MNESTNEYMSVVEEEASMRACLCQCFAAACLCAMCVRVWRGSFSRWLL